MNGDINALIAALIAKASAGNVTPDQIQTAVDNYLAENPVQAGEMQLTGTTLSLEGGNS